MLLCLSFPFLFATFSPLTKTLFMKKIFFPFFSLLFSLILVSCGAPVPGTTEVLPTDHLKGNIQSPVLFVEYSDFQCPACGYYANMIHEAWPQIENQVLFVYRNYPLMTIHQYAQLASSYAEAAAKQGKFWEMHDKLFENQDTWSKSLNVPEMLDGYAKELGLNIETLHADINSSEVKQKIRADIASGNKQSLNSTPTFFINGKKIENPRTKEELVEMIESAR